MKILLRIICLLPLALPLTFVLIRWPLAFAVVGGGLCVLALVAMAVMIATSGHRQPLADKRASATVDGRPVEVEVLP